MRRPAALIQALISFVAAAAAETPLQPGLYEVEVNLDLPHLEGMGASRTATVCVDNSGTSPTHGLVVLSTNNPLGTCPASNIKADGNVFSFEVHCEGKNAAEGFAKYLLAPQGFEGTIAMKMGGKNMTMTETQKGKRRGECPVQETN